LSANNQPIRAVVRHVLPNVMFRVEIAGGRLIRAHVAHEARGVITRLVPGDQVIVQLSETDHGECRILGRPRDARGR
jgi:translation initiation factor IF-1